MSSDELAGIILHTQRKSGLLLHISSLPSIHGIGDLGPAAFEFVDFLKASNQSFWQILPLGPTGFGDSPYACLSAFAGNPLFISLEKLVDENLLKSSDLEPIPIFPKDKVDFAKVIHYKFRILKIAFQYFLDAKGEVSSEFIDFCKKNEYWLSDYSLYATLKQKFDLIPWNEWPIKFRNANKNYLKSWADDNRKKILYHQFLQFLFFKQWRELRAYAHDKNVYMIGDLPLYVSYDSADVWMDRDLFLLDDNGNSEYVSGVPPDALNDDGQLWGTPVYDWEYHISSQFDWWIKRIKFSLHTVDFLRLDHFIGYFHHWRIPRSHDTAKYGEWIPTPGEELLTKIRENYPNMPFIVEDLGLVGPGVIALRDKFELPPMKVLQFAFDHHWNAGNYHLPHNFVRNMVVYTGTHDNDTLVGWFNNLSEETKQSIYEYCNSEENIHLGLIKIAWASIANLSITQVQDLLGLNGNGRMNNPGRISGNWRWRLRPSHLQEEHQEFLTKITQLYGRE